VTPQNYAAHVQNIFSNAPLVRDLGHLKRSILLRRDLVISGSALEGLDRLRIICGITSST
jgi:hypothetical protein